MRCAIIGIHDDNYKEMADLTWHRNRKLYAEHRGYDAIAKIDKFGSLDIGWWKIQILLELMNKNQHDVFFISGADTMITNFTIPLTNFLYDGYSVTLSTDFNGIQADSLVVRNDANGRAWCQMIMDKMPDYIRHPFREQGTMMETTQLDPWNKIVKVVPQRFINSYFYDLYCPGKGAKNHNDAMGFNGNWQKGDWLLHCPDHKMPVRMALFNHILPLVIS